MQARTNKHCKHNTMNRMKKISLILSMLLLAGPLFAQQTFEWSEAGGGKNSDVVSGITCINNDIYVTGSFSGEFTIGNIPLDGEGMTDIFLAKLDQKGNVSWGKSLTGEGANKASCLKTDGESIFQGGIISETVRQDKNQYEGEGKSVYIASWNKQGKINWLTRLPFSGNATLDVLETAPDGTLFIGGLLHGTLRAGSSELTSQTVNRAYWMTLSGDGKPLDAWLSSGEGNHRLVSAAIDSLNNRYMLFSVNGDFSTGGDSILQVTTPGKKGLVLLKTGNTGATDWVKFWECPGYSEGTKILLSPENELIVCANYNKELKLGDTLHTSTSQLESVVVSYKTSGEPRWIKTLSSPVKSRLMDAMYTQNGNLLLAGYFRESCHINEDVMYSAIPGNSLFLFQLDKDGTPVWQDEPGEVASGFCKAITLDKEGNIILAGSFRGEFRMDDKKLLSAGKTDVVIAKYFNCGNSEVKILGDNVLCPGGETMLSASGDYYSYLWNNEYWGNDLAIDSAGTYSVVAYDGKGCTASDTMVVKILNGEDLGLPDNVYISPGESKQLAAASGFFSYMWEDGTQTAGRMVNYSSGADSTILVLSAETYQGCQISDSVVVYFNHTNSTAQRSAAFLQAYPNPVSNNLTWFAQTGSPTDIVVYITDNKSTRVYLEEIKNYYPHTMKTISMAPFASGNYLLNIQTKEETYHLKIVKK